MAAAAAFAGALFWPVVAAIGASLKIIGPDAQIVFDPVGSSVVVDVPFLDSLARTSDLNIYATKTELSDYVTRVEVDQLLCENRRGIWESGACTEVVDSRNQTRNLALTHH